MTKKVMNSSSDKNYRHILQRLDTLRKRIKKWHLLEGLLWFVTIAISAALLITVMEAVFRFDSVIRTALLVCSGGLVLLSFLWFICRPLWSLYVRTRFPDDYDLAMRVGHHFDGIKDRLIDAIQVYQKHRENRESYSLDLADAALLDAQKTTEDLDFKQVVRLDSSKKALKILGAVAAGTLLLTVLLQSRLTNASYRLLHPDQTFKTDAGVTFLIEPGNAEVVKGDSLDIDVALQGVSVSTISRVDLFVRKAQSGAYERTVLDAAPGYTENRRNFKHTLKDIRQAASYYVQTARHKSREYQIDVIETPMVRNLQIKLDYPDYSKMGTLFLDNNVGDI
jgi:hypothetical protein